MFVLKHNETGKYVARPGAEHSYTSELEEAQVFQTQADAEKNRCVDSETVRSVAILISGERN